MHSPWDQPCDNVHADDDALNLGTHLQQQSWDIQVSMIGSNVYRE